MASGRTVSVSVNGGAAAGSATTAVDGTYTISGITAASGAVVAVYLQGNTEVGVLVTLSTGSDMAGMDIYQNDLVTRSDNGGLLTAANLTTGRANNATGLSSIYSTTTSHGITSAVTLATGKSLYIPAGHSLAPGGNITLTVPGSFTNRGTYVATTSTTTVLTGAASGERLTSNGSAFGPLTINAPAGTYTLQDPLIVNNTLTLTAGTLDVSVNNYGVTLKGSLTVTSGAFTARSGTVTFAGTSGVWTLNGNALYGLTVTSGTLAFVGSVTATGPTIVSGGTLQIPTGGNAATLQGGMMVNGGTVAFGSTLNVGDLSLSSGTFNVSTTTNISGNLSITGGTWSNSLRNVIFTGTGSHTLKTNGNDLTAVLHPLTFNAPGGTYTLQDALIANAGIKITAGTLDVSTNNYGVTVGNNWQNSGTFTARGGTVTLNGTNQTLSGSTTFYNLTKTVTSPDTLTFAAGTTQTVTNTLTLQGAASNLLSLRSTQTGNQWKLDPQGTRSLSYLDVEDSNNVNATAIATAGNNITNSGNNTNWTFTQSSTTTLASSPNPSTYGSGVTLTATVTSGATGTVTFKDGSTTLGTATLGHSSGSLVISSLSVGTHSLTAVYGGDSTYLTSTSNTVTQTVNQASSTTALSSGTNPSSYGNSVTFTATVSPSAATGTLTFKDGSTTIGTATLGHGSGTYTTSSLSAGSHSLTAVYGGNSNYATSTSSTLTQTVNKVTPTLTLASGTNPSTYGNSITLTATLSSPATGTGTITFKDGSTTIGSATVSQGSGSLAIATLNAGSHSLTAVYNGDTNDNSATSNTVTQTVNQASTTTALASGTNPSTYGSSVTFTATVSPSTATGTVTIKDGSTTLGTCTLSSGSCTYATSALSAGSHSMTAVYGGNSNFSGSTSTILTQTVNQASTTTSLASSLNPSTYGSGVALTATVTPSTATGTLTFKDGSTTIGTATLGHGSGNLTISTLGAGTHSLTAVYGGNGNYAGSTSSTLTQTVTKASTTTSLVSSLNPATFGSGITLTATVSPSTATGTLTFTDGSTTLGTATIGHGSGTYTTPSLSAGSHSLTAVFSGNQNYLTSTSSAVTQTVTAAATLTTLHSDFNPSNAGDFVSFTATVAPTSATGTVTIEDGSTPLGTCTLSAGSCTYTTSTLSAGNHVLTAVYGGSGNYGGSTSPALTQVVGPSLVGSGGRSAGTVRGGGRRPQTMARLVDAAKQEIVARFEDQLAQGASIAEAGSSSSAQVLARRPQPRSSPSSSAASALAQLPLPSSSSSAPSRRLVQAPVRPPSLQPNIPAIAARRGRLAVAVGDQDVLYKDVEIDAWYAPYVASLIQTGVAQGYRDASGSLTGRFGVDQPVTRAEVLKMALQAAGKQPSGQLPRNASARGTWASGYVRTAEDLHLTVFTPDTDVNAPATRGEVVQTLLEALGFPIGTTPSSFSDVPRTHPHSAAIALAAFYGFVSGDTGPDGTPLNRFRPDAPMNRAEVAKLIALVREVVGPPAQR